MKTKILPLLTALSLVVLGSCIETEYIEIEKLVTKTDTLTKYVDRVFAGVDSTKIPAVVETPVPTREKEDSIIIQKDTVWMVRVDSIFITTTVYEKDTLVVHTKEYGDTLVIYLFNRTAMNFPPHLEPYWSWFFEQCDARGIPYQGPGPVYLTTGKLDAVIQSMSFYVFGQFVISINDNLTESEQFTPLMRELARNYLGKEYSQDPNSILNPFFSARTIRWDNKDQHLEELEELFR